MTPVQEPSRDEGGEDDIAEKTKPMDSEGTMPKSMGRARGQAEKGRHMKGRASCGARCNRLPPQLVLANGLQDLAEGRLTMRFMIQSDRRKSRLTARK